MDVQTEKNPQKMHYHTKHAVFVGIRQTCCSYVLV